MEAGMDRVMEGWVDGRSVGGLNVGMDGSMDSSGDGWMDGGMPTQHG